MRTEQAGSLERQGIQGTFALFKCKIFAAEAAKTLHLPSVQCAAPMGMRIVSMSEIHKNG